MKMSKTITTPREIRDTVPMKVEQDDNLREHLEGGKELLEIKNRTAETELSTERLEDSWNAFLQSRGKRQRDGK